ncbi:hypothetical protein BC829DRAFT_406067 [Chytridium lagenaria]|nr:hypothetical protein BC829DRAFT_406067 [Chytridium lagenaria]
MPEKNRPTKPSEVDEVFSKTSPPPSDTPSSGGPIVAFAVAMVTFMLYVVTLWLSSEIYKYNLIPDYVYPYLKTHLGVMPKDIPFYGVAVVAALTYPVSAFVMTISRTVAYTGLAARAQAAHHNAIEGFPLLVAAVLISQKPEFPNPSDHSKTLTRPLIPSNTFSHRFITFSVLFRLAHYTLYLLNVHFLRSLAWIASIIPLVLLLVAAAVPGFARTYLVPGAFV